MIEIIGVLPLQFWPYYNNPLHSVSLSNLYCITKTNFRHISVFNLMKYVCIRLQKLWIALTSMSIICCFGFYYLVAPSTLISSMFDVPWFNMFIHITFSIGIVGTVVTIPYTTIFVHFALNHRINVYNKNCNYNLFWDGW